jgi:His-Xaa-Ser system protein HxsD
MLVSLAKSAYSAEALNRAAYKAAPLGTVGISESETSWEVSLAPSEGHDEESLSHEFHTNLADESLREVIRSRTEALRSLILAHAYSNTRIASEDSSS